MTFFVCVYIIGYFLKQQFNITEHSFLNSFPVPKHDLQRYEKSIFFLSLFIHLFKQKLSFLRSYRETHPISFAFQGLVHVILYGVIAAYIPKFYFLLFFVNIILLLPGILHHQILQRGIKKASPHAVNIYKTIQIKLKEVINKKNNNNNNNKDMDTVTKGGVKNITGPPITIPYNNNHQSPIYNQQPPIYNEQQQPQQYQPVRELHNQHNNIEQMAPPQYQIPESYDNEAEFNDIYFPPEIEEQQYDNDNIIYNYEVDHSPSAPPVNDFNNPIIIDDFLMMDELNEHSKKNQ
eukprot:TRINITY_DN6847_c0_g1_i2.p1 TRINITY_DN6847_c0_g1~~TRINITY_DN6847_c0_g1_i2.p1  ORF type:complete len:292 (-),score=86.03 TRINITY_DN6847_c0_g1_i2:97-972(-)